MNTLFLDFGTLGLLVFGAFSLGTISCIQFLATILRRNDPYGDNSVGVLGCYIMFALVFLNGVLWSLRLGLLR